MKKLSSLAFVFALLFSLSSIPAYAMDNTGMSGNQTRSTDSFNNVNNYQTNDGVTNDYRANNVNNYRYNDGVTNDYRAHNVTNNQAHRYRATANNYRATAADNNRGSNWGWLGLLGLTGLFGLRSRERERS